MPILNGTVLNDRYSICKLLGSGGMAQVYLAQDLKNGQFVAVKMLKPEFNDDREFLRRFDTEARAASSLSHDNIVKVLGVGEDHGMRYMVQEYVDGVTLKEMILHYHRLDWRVAVPIFVQIAMALESAHAGGVIHRDIKPQNIIINKQLKAYVTDFGIARANNQNTVAGGSGTLGSVHYFSPEQAQGGIVSERSDIYSLGVLMYETLTGSLPFEADTSVTVALKHINEQPAPPISIEPLVPQPLSDIVMKCLNKSPNTRYNSARDLISELDAFMINPQGVFGIAKDARKHNSFTELNTGRTKLNSGNTAGDKLAKLRYLEETMNKRRSSRRRETGFIIILLIAAIAAIGVLGYRFIDDFRTELSSNQVPPVKLADFIGHTLTESEKALREAGITPEIEYVYSDKYDKDIVIKQNICPNSRFFPNGLQKLVLTVSKGNDLTKIGNYVGLMGEEVKRELQQKGLAVEIKEVKNENYQKGYVVKQSPAADSVLKKNETIVLYISTGSDKVTFQPQRGKSAKETSEWLKSQGLEINEVILESADNNLTVDNAVVSYVAPAGNNKAYIGGDKIDVGTKVDIHACSQADLANTIKNQQEQSDNDD